MESQLHVISLCLYIMTGQDLTDKEKRHNFGTARRKWCNSLSASRNGKLQLLVLSSSESVLFLVLLFCKACIIGPGQPHKQDISCLPSSHCDNLLSAQLEFA